MIAYKLLKDTRTDEVNSVLRSDGWSIPFDEANVDFQQYQLWLSEGNVPEPADEPTLS